MNKLDLTLYKDIINLLEMDEGIYTAHLDCPESGGPDHKNRLWMIRREAGIAGYCHHCNNKGFLGFRLGSSLFSSKVVNVAQTAHLPQDYTSKIPGKELNWLYSYDLKTKELEEYKIGYSPSLNRIIYPLRDFDYKIIGWQGRSVSGSPKYITSKGTNATGFFTGFFPTQRIVIVEDVVSAIRIGRFTNAVALLGTSLKKELKIHLIKNYKYIQMWLDADAKDKVKELDKAFRLYMATRIISTVKDPKAYTDSEIEQFITARN